MCVHPLSVVVLRLDEVGEVDGLGLGAVSFVDVLGTDVLHVVAAAALGATAKRTVAGDLGGDGMLVVF